MNSESQTILLIFIVLSFVVSVFSKKAKKKEQSFIVNIIVTLIYGIPLLLGYTNNKDATASFICWIFILVAMLSHSSLLIIIGVIKTMLRWSKDRS